MTAPSPLTAGRALLLLREVVAGQEDFIYRTDGAESVCVYFRSGQPSCLVGHVLAKAGFPPLSDEDENNWAGVESATLPEWFADFRAVGVLAAAQGDQDLGLPWGEALTSAEDKARQLGVTA